ncbi:MAG: prepilin-type N-terminal cleavage/methylation domain-containing protein [Acidimicrobiales bacterium]|jgi:type IV pilus assembly protein PilA
MTPDHGGRCGGHLRSVSQREEAFTLVELLVVLLIIGILLAIAIPTFLSTTSRANTTSAQSNLQIALTSADAYYTQANQTYAGVITGSDSEVSDLSAIDTNLTFYSGTNSTGLNVISLWTDNSTSLVLAAYAQGTQDCWYVIDLKAPSATVWGGLGTGTYYALDQGVDASDCVAQETAPNGASAAQTGGWPAS